MTIWDNVMMEDTQRIMSDIAARERATNPPKMKSIRTSQVRFDKDLYEEQDGVRLGTNYVIHDGYNMEVSILIFDVICAVTGEVNFDNAVRTIRVIKDFVPEPVKFKQPKPPKIRTPKKGRPKPVVVDFKLECLSCKRMKDIRYDYYKGRRVCKECYKQSVIQKRRDKKCV